jgi:hypothetical protein
MRCVSVKSMNIFMIVLVQCMAWLIHEPRLRGEVPVFSLSGVSPLMVNPRAHESVAVGAVHLLTHLHNRLEVRK